MTRCSVLPKAAAVPRLAAVLASILVVALFAGALAAAGAAESVAIRHDGQGPRVAFAVAELRAALQEAGYRVVDSRGDWTVTFGTFRQGMGPQSFRIRREGEREIRVVGGDSLGTMYGGLELAEMIQFAGGFQGVVEKARKPYLLRRGIKFNIPLDARAPSYDDTGTAAQENIPVVWEWNFWRDFLDQLARDRYNVLTLWTNHPYPSLVDLKKYPGVSYEDVCRLRGGVDPSTDRHFDKIDVMDPANLEVVKKTSLPDKIAFWQRVFDHAEARGIDVIIFHWNIYTFGAKGKYGITDDMSNPKTIEYLRYCISEFLKTYPQVDGIGITAGEHMRGARQSRLGKEQWLWQTYGRGVMDTLAADPDRRLRIIFRQHQANLGRIVEAFREFPGPFHTGHKYARARLYSTTTSPYLDIEYRADLQRYKVPCWLNLRNDDLFVFRWGDAGYVREFLQNVPRDLMRYEAGFYMGPDGYVFGRDFASCDSELRGRLEIDKHWYRYMLWGRLAYDLTLPRAYFEKRLARRFPGVDAALLDGTWATASRIVPQVNRFFFRVNDFQFSPEGCVDNRGFLALEQFFQHPPLVGSGILSVQEYAQAVVEGRQADGITPMEVADRLDRLAAQSLAGAEKLSRAAAANRELNATLTDIRAMAHLGRYYADKIRGAAQLAVFRADGTRKEFRQRAAACLTNAVEHWRDYAQVASAAYRPQLLSRTHFLDWEKRLNDVEREAKQVAEQQVAR